MEPIRVVGGTGHGPTAMASYDAALAGANLCDYNLVQVSSVVPETATVEQVERAPDLGPAGNRLTVVQGRRTVEPGGGRRAVAGVGWATGPGPGLLYEAEGDDPGRVDDELRRGLDAGRDLREWDLPRRDTLVEVADPEPGSWTTAVAVAAFGGSEPIAGRGFAP